MKKYYFDDHFRFNAGKRLEGNAKMIIDQGN